MHGFRFRFWIWRETHTVCTNTWQLRDITGGHSYNAVSLCPQVKHFSRFFPDFPWFMQHFPAISRNSLPGPPRRVWHWHMDWHFGESCLIFGKKGINKQAKKATRIRLFSCNFPTLSFLVSVYRIWWNTAGICQWISLPCELIENHQLSFSRLAVYTSWTYKFVVICKDNIQYGAWHRERNRDIACFAVSSIWAPLRLLCFFLLRLPQRGESLWGRFFVSVWVSRKCFHTYFVSLSYTKYIYTRALSENLMLLVSFASLSACLLTHLQSHPKPKMFWATRTSLRPSLLSQSNMFENFVCF